jgi:cell division protein FtsZ
MQRRLVEALQHSQMPTPPLGSQSPVRGARDDMGRARSGGSWQGPGNVTIEDGPPQLSVGHMPPPLPDTRREHEGEYEGFMPAPPAEIRRPPRRMPELGDFPPVAQRAYRAMEPAPREPRAHDEDMSWDRHEEPRRLTLFERLAGRVLPTSDSSRRKQARNTPLPQDDYSEYGEPSEPYADEYDADAAFDAQDPEYTGVLNRRRR